MDNSIIWIFFAGACIFWLYSASGKMKAQQKQQIEYEENRVKYRNFTSEMFDGTPDDELTQAVMFHIMTKEDKLYSRFGDKEPTILSVERWTAYACIDFRYYSPPIKRAKYIFTMFGGSKFHIWHEGFMPEYESYCISRTMEDDWRKVLAGH